MINLIITGYKQILRLDWLAGINTFAILLLPKLILHNILTGRLYNMEGILNLIINSLILCSIIILLFLNSFPIPKGLRHLSCKLDINCSRRTMSFNNLIYNLDCLIDALFTTGLVISYVFCGSFGKYFFFSATLCARKS